MVETDPAKTSGGEDLRDMPASHVLFHLLRHYGVDLQSDFIQDHGLVRPFRPLKRDPNHIPRAPISVSMPRKQYRNIEESADEGSPVPEPFRGRPSTGGRPPALCRAPESSRACLAS